MGGVTKKRIIIVFPIKSILIKILFLSNLIYRES